LLSAILQRAILPVINISPITKYFYYALTKQSFSIALHTFVSKIKVLQPTAQLVALFCCWHKSKKMPPLIASIHVENDSGRFGNM
jgi:hypothetical protein